jgi:NAD(P)-dependent dehydrogenase (short-subunit alcohol dehydrogenase family)
MQSLSDQRVLVIDGSSGIGFATAAAAVDAGAAVTIASRNQRKLDSAAAKLGSAVQALDTRDNNLLEHFFQRVQPWDHVVVSAAQTKGGPVRNLELADAAAAMDSKFWGAYRVARAARIRNGGSLTFISGFLSERPSGTAVLQGAINAALESLVRGLALEFA